MKGVSPETADDPRVYMAAERTFLAWIRTGLALMGFGFVVARFGLFLRHLNILEHQLPAESSGFSSMLGTALVFLGVLVNVVAAIQHVRIVHALQDSQVRNGPSRAAIAVAVTLACAGLAMVVYLLVVR